MATNNQTPTFNMKVVVQETGLKPDTLRAWERRYGIPNPQRTSGGHRLYSQYEIDMLKWMVARQDEGMSISHAVELWQQLLKEGKNPLFRLETAVSEPAVLRVTGERVEEMRQAWIEACLNFDEYQAQQLLARAFALFPLETVCYEILRQGLMEIGQGWIEGRVSVQQEHFTSALALRQMEALLAALPAPTRSERLIVACPPEELHTFAPLMISLMLRRQGWDVVYLGASVPLDRLKAAVDQIKPMLVILSAQTLATAANMLPMAQNLHEWRMPLAFGGAVFNHIPQIIDIIPGHFLGKTLEQVSQVVEKMLHARALVGRKKAPSAEHRAAYRHFVARRSAVEAALHESPRLADLPPAVVQAANRELGNNLAAGLRLGDMSVVSSNLEWMQGLLLNNHERLAEEMFTPYLQAYNLALQSKLDERGAPLLAWFAERL